MSSKPIFFDPPGRRGRVLSVLAWASGAISLISIAAFVLTLMIIDSPENSSTAPSKAPAIAVTRIAVTRGAVDPALLKSAHELAAELRERERTLAQPFQRSAAANLPID